jgi:hypothetical protein
MNQIIIWKDVILLDWDKRDLNNIAPPLASAHWRYLNGIAHWSTKVEKFILPLSKNNLDRIFKQFGAENVQFASNSKQAADALISANHQFKMMCAKAKQIKSAPITQLPTYDYKLPPLAEYQHRGVVLLTEIPRMPLFADCGCLTGDTLVKINRNRTSRNINLKYLLYKLNHQWSSNEIKIRSFKGEFIGLHPIRKVIESGIKEVFKLTLKDGKTLKGTYDHEILTDHGWVQLGKLINNDSVMVDNLTKHKSKEVKHKSKKNPDSRCAVGAHHLYARKQLSHKGRSFSYLVEVHRLVFEAYMNHMSLEEFIKGTYKGFIKEDIFFVDTKRYCVHHKNGDHYDNRPENLEMLDLHKHMSIHTAGYLNFGHGIPEYSKVVSVISVGKEMTYDIVCEEPHRNFVANGIVVHNCGKTFMALTSTQNHIKSGVIQPGKTLICAKLATLESSWLEDAKKFTDLQLVNLWLPQSKNRKAKIIDLLSTPADAYLINHEGVLVFKDALREKKFNKVIVDESTIIKGFHGDKRNTQTGKFANALLEISQCAHWRVIMTGTPAPNGPEDLWGQMNFLDPKGNLLEKQFNEFRHLYFNAKKFMMGKKQIVKWEPLPDTFSRISTVLEPLMYRLRIRDHLDLPNLVSMKRSVLMDKEQEKHYSDLKKYLVTVINDERVNTPIKVTQLMKLRQVTGGFLMDHKEEAHALPKNPKIEELDSILEEEIGRDEKVVIYCQYRWEINLIESRYKKYGCLSVFGDNTSKQNIDNIRTFIDDKKIRIIVLHPRSAAHGVTFTVAHYMVFYSISYSEEEHYQCVKRIERAGQKSNMVVMYLFCKDSIDELIYGVLQEKAKDQQRLIDVDEMFIETWRTQHG